jgi:hypothetical protein
MFAFGDEDDGRNKASGSRVEAEVEVVVRVETCRSQLAFIARLCGTYSSCSSTSSSRMNIIAVD